MERGDTATRWRGREMTRIETFVDAAFAFAVTLLIVSIDEIPETVPELIEAIKGAPAFAASFAIICVFWHSHHRWSETYGLDDGPTRVLSLVLVFQVLLYVYPLKMLSTSFMHWLSGGLLPPGVALASTDDLVTLYTVYGLGFAGLGATIAALYVHAWRRREVLGLGAGEITDTRTAILATALVAGCGLLSALVAILLPANPRSWHLVLPGFAYNMLFVLPFVLRQLAKSRKGAGAGS